jgi:hypothetical protein
LRRIENFEEWIGREVEGFVIEYTPENDALSYRVVNCSKNSVKAAARPRWSKSRWPDA